MLVFLIILLTTILYAVPGLIATGRHHSRAWRVWLVDILLGFTVIGWLWSLREALRPDAGPRKLFYRYSYYGEETRKARFDIRQLPLGDVGLALAGLVAIAAAGTFGWHAFAPQAATVEAAAATVSGPGSWSYTVESGNAGPIHVSTLMSDDAYASGDGIPAALVLRNGPDAPSAAIRIDGQFTCSAAANGTISAQFDGGQAVTLHCAPRPDGVLDLDAAGQDVLFLADPQAFISRVRAARSLVLTADVLGQGAKHAHFSPQGLDIAMAGLSEEAAVAPVPDKPVADKPATAEAVVSKTADVHPVRTAAHHDRHTAAHKARPKPHYKSWHD